jgi:hypothetical protein
VNMPVAADVDPIPIATLQDTLRAAVTSWSAVVRKGRNGVERPILMGFLPEPAGLAPVAILLQGNPAARDEASTESAMIGVGRARCRRELSEANDGNPMYKRRPASLQNTGYNVVCAQCAREQQAAALQFAARCNSLVTPVFELSKSYPTFDPRPVSALSTAFQRSARGR